MSAHIHSFQIGKRYADDSGWSHEVDVDTHADTLHISINESRLLASPADIDWLIDALTTAKQVIEGKQP